MAEERISSLLERERALESLEAALTQVRAGRGSVALVLGEAGIGKTAIAGLFAGRHAAQMRVLAADCEALQTPRPFGPLIDIADRLPARVARAMHAGEPYNGLFPDLLAWAREAPTLLVLEDLHWADWATLDLVRYVARRIDDVPLLLLLTYRDDEVSLDHPLLQVLGGLPRDVTRRIALAPLSAQAVARMAGNAGRSDTGVHRITGGNPFFVTELLACDDGAVPASVRDAVLARVGALSPAARAVASWVSVAPQEIERVLLQELAAPESGAIDECQSRGILLGGANALRFRHELARTCVEQSLPAERRTQMHAAVFAALSRRADADLLLARRVHHAQQAGLADAVADLAPRAARAAAAASAHRDAAAMYAVALRHADRLAPPALLEVLEAQATECTLIQAVDAAAAARQRALALHRQSGDLRAQGWNLTRLATLWITRPEALDYSTEAVALLEQLAPGRELAWACADRAAVLTARSRAVDALEWGRRAVALAEPIGEPEVLAHALNICGAVELSLEYTPGALAKLERSLALAEAHGLPQKVGLAYLNLAGMALVNHDHARLLAYAERGLAFAAGRDLDFIVAALHLRRMFAWFDLGRWRDVEEELDRLDAMPALLPRERSTVRIWRARLHALTGRTNDAAEWRELLALGTGAQTELRPAAVAGICAEAAWLRADPAAVQRIVADALPPAIASGESSTMGELLAWLKRCNAEVPAVDIDIAPQYRFELAGDWKAAAQAWKQLGCVYERAMVLLAGDEAALQEALEVLAALGAAPIVEIVRRRLRQRGVRGLPRGPYQTARADPLGLTRRERQIFDLVVEGHSNAAIAGRLHRSERTIEHHVAGIFDKLGVTSRAQLRAYAQGALEK
jgi:DNA-binding CsgD family transcriptional regulator